MSSDFSFNIIRLPWSAEKGTLIFPCLRRSRLRIWSRVTGLMFNVNNNLICPELVSVHFFTEMRY